MCSAYAIAVKSMNVSEGSVAASNIASDDVTN